jgi:DNA (cytosine-5)-methyltransferase 1
MELDEEPMQSHRDNEAALIEAVAEEAEFDETDLESDFDNVQQQPQTSSKGLVIEIPVSTLITPRSAFRSDVSTSREYKAVQSLLESDPTQLDEDFVEFELDDFVVYIDAPRHPQEMRAMHTFATSTGQTKFFFNGTLKLGNLKYRVEKAPFEEIPLGNYGQDNPTVGDQLWIRSDLNRRNNIYYKLKTPSIEYARFHTDFLWVADLAKHVVDFSEHLLGLGQNVSIRRFEQDFARWLQATHGSSPTFQKWYNRRGANDFRQSIIANQFFVRKELFAMFDGQKWSRIHIFREIAKPFGMYSRQGLPSEEIAHTIVTPYIFDCFSHMKMGEILKPVQPSVSTGEAVALSWPADGTKNLRFIRSTCTSKNRQTMIDSIKPGDTISIVLDADAKWYTNKADKKWYGLVQSVSTVRSRRQFDITWLYDPEDTPCCSMRYPWENELFLSDHCTCEEEQGRIPEHAVIGVHTVEWFGTPQTKAEFFIRQTYQVEQRRWVTLKQAHIRCHHGEQWRPEYLVGETVLVSTPGTAVLEPCEILAYDATYTNTRLRRFIRRETIVSQSARNELVYTDEEFSAAIDCIHARCIIRCYCPGEAIPAPYNRGGTGNAFVITHRKSADGSIHPLSSANKPKIRQGFDPKRRVKKLRALDLFSGCGNFGRGLEDGGAVEAKWVNDIWDAAIHTYMANSRDPESVHPFLGDIDDLNLYAFEGMFSDSVPRPGQVDLICGGSPCPGFSLITPNQQTIRQAKNRSLVAAFAANVDFYRPKYGILENVKTIVQSKRNGKGKITEDYFSQLICALVGMGYQVQIILGDAWSHGAPQARVRAFLYFAAPGLELPQPPVPSHSHPDKKRYGSLGMMTNREPYTFRLDKPTAFQYVTALQATADLPDVYDAKTETCVAFPDHRLSISLSSGHMNTGVRGGRGRNGRIQSLNMPIRPFAMNISRAWHHTIRDNLSGDTVRDMFDHERDAYPGNGSHRSSGISKGWGRVHPHGLFHTVTTVCSWTDARIGRLSHWDQPRPLTVMEVRRAQGIPDNEVLLGRPSDQWGMVGNAVARQIAMALGLTLRKAWVGTLYEDDEAATLAPEEEEEEQRQAGENGAGFTEAPVVNGYSPMLLD